MSHAASAEVKPPLTARARLEKANQAPPREGADVFEDLYLEGLGRAERQAHRESVRYAQPYGSPTAEPDRRPRTQALKVKPAQGAQPKPQRSHSAGRLVDAHDAHIGREADFVQRREERRKR